MFQVRGTSHLTDPSEFSEGSARLRFGRFLNFSTMVTRDLLLG